VKSIEVVDDTTVSVTLDSHSDNFLFHMAAGSACIVSSKSVSTNRTNPVGTGPFKFGAWNRGASLTLTRNDAYWGTKAKLKDIQFRFISDADAMNNALKAGDIDAIGQVNGPEQLTAFQRDPNFTIVKGAPSGKFMVSITRRVARWPISACGRRSTPRLTVRPGSLEWARQASPCRSAATRRQMTASRIARTSLTLQLMPIHSWWRSSRDNP
jgi:ABC-type transport system substrate-binding protein